MNIKFTTQQPDILYSTDKNIIFLDTQSAIHYLQKIPLFVLAFNIFVELSNIWHNF